MYSEWEIDGTPCQVGTREKNSPGEHGGRNQAFERNFFQRARFLGKSWIGNEEDLHAVPWSPTVLKRTSCPGFLCEQLF